MERRFSLEAEIEILKHEISVLKAMCKDLRFTMEAQNHIKEIELVKKNKLARKNKTVESQAEEKCDQSPIYGSHLWKKKTMSTDFSLSWWQECEFCREEKLGSRASIK